MIQRKYRALKDRYVDDIDHNRTPQCIQKDKIYPEKMVTYTNGNIDRLGYVKDDENYWYLIGSTLFNEFFELEVD